MSNFGRNGRLGNQLFQYATMRAQSRKYEVALKLPKWEYSEYFDWPFPEGEVPYTDFIHNEPDFHFCGDFGLLDKHADQPIIDIKGYWQSPMYWKGQEKAIRALFQFKAEFKAKQKAWLPNGNNIAIHIRRGDYLTNPNHYNLPISYYIQTLIENFPGWQKQNLIIFSDDIPYCKLHFGSLPNAYFSDGSEIEDLCRMSLCDNFIIANSSFSWWGAYLADKGKVIRPVNHFDGNLKETCDIKDLYPTDWTAFDPVKKIPLRDVTFTIPVFYDHPDRKKNLDLCVCLLQHYFDTNIIVTENKSLMFGYMTEWVTYLRSEHQVFHRTAMLNEMAQLAQTEYIFNWDADVTIPPLQILKAVQELRNGADMVYPYNGQFARVPRMPFFRQLESCLDVGFLSATRLDGTGEKDKESFGGAVGWNRKRFFEAGGENENFISFGAEDYERYERASKLGYVIKRVRGCLFHLNHWIGTNSSTRNPYFIHNRVEYEKVKGMSKEELEDYIKTWEC
jgi:hypothetical protein